MHHLVLTPDRNRPPENDFSGAFEPESIRYKAFHEGRGDTVTIQRIHAAPSRSRREVLRDVQSAIQATRFNALAFMCHGTINWLQLGLSSGSATGLQSLAETAAMIAASAPPDLRVILYACSSGRAGAPGDTAPGTGENSFADHFRDALCAAGCVNISVYAHTSAGHTTRNPDIRVFRGLGLPSGGVGGMYLVRPGTRPQYSTLARLLRSNTPTPLRFEYPFLTIEEIHARLV